MPVRNPLHTTINTTDPITKKITLQWNTVINDILARGIRANTNIDPVVANRYKFDFYGLLLYLGIEEKYHYPHLLVNGYTNPTTYQGDIYSIILIKTELLHTYHTAFTRNLVL